MKQENFNLSMYNSYTIYNISNRVQEVDVCFYLLCLSQRVPFMQYIVIVFTLSIPTEPTSPTREPTFHSS